MSFEKGISGNPKGKPRGTLNKENAQIRDVIQKCLNWIDRGDNLNTLLSDVAKNNPSVLLNFLARIAPRDLSIKLNEPMNNPVLEQITLMRKAIEEKHRTLAKN